MALQLAPGPGSDHGSMYGDSQRGRGNSGGGARPTSYYGSGPGPDAAGYGAPGGGQVSTRTRSRSVADPRQYTKDGRVILHYGEFSLDGLFVRDLLKPRSTGHVYLSSSDPGRA